jgi:hypothetical protein
MIILHHQNPSRMDKIIRKDHQLLIRYTLRNIHLIKATTTYPRHYLTTFYKMRHKIIKI